MQKKLMMMIIPIIMIVGIISYAISGYVETALQTHQSEQFLEKALKQTKDNSQIIDENTIKSRLQNKDINIEQLLRTKGYYEDDIIKSMRKYIELSIMSNIGENENNYIISFINLDYDFEKVLDIYAFLQLTNDDISYIKKIYDIGKTINFESKHWIDDAYEKVSGGQALSMEQIYHYTNNGIPFDEVLSAYQMSLQGTKTVQQILDEKSSGKSWANLAAEVYIDYEIDPISIEKLTNPKDIVSLVMMAKKTGNKVKDMLEQDTTEIVIKDTTKHIYGEKQDILNKTLKSYNLDSITNNRLVNAIKKEFPDIPDDAVNEMIKNDYRIKDVKAVSRHDIKNQNYKSSEINDFIRKSNIGGEKGE